MTETPERPDLFCKSCGHPVLIDQFNALVGACAKCLHRRFTPKENMEFIPFEDTPDSRFRQAVERVGGYHVVMKYRVWRHSLVELAREVYHQETP